MATADVKFSAEENQLIDDCFAFIKPVIRNAGELVNEGFSRSNDDVGVVNKSSWDKVTDYDLKTEAFLLNAIKAEYADHRFIAEESDTANNVVTDDPTWIIDPIDGTNNYVQRIPFVAISVAFAWKKEICFGITYNPILNEFYEARLGNGAFLNGKPIRCSSIAQLKDATIGHEVSFIRVEKYRERNLKQVTAFATASHGFRSFGSCCVSLALVARGTLDGYQMNELYVWDIAAGILLIREAGGYCCKPDGSSIDLNDPKIICASTKRLCDEMIELNKEALGL